MSLQIFDVGWVASLVCLTFIYCVSLIFYRLYLSPLAQFPGSKLAAATLWYEFYCENIQRGQFSFKIREWHKQYGPIIRINPHELHINDPTGEFYHVVFSGTAVRDKHKYYTAQFGTPKTDFGTVSHYLHRMRRKATNPFFAHTNILRFEPTMKIMLDKLCVRIEEYKKSNGLTMNMRIAYMCFTTDVITSFALSHSWNFLDAKDFNPWWWETTQNTAAMTKWTKQFPWIFPIMQSLPDFIVAAMNPSLILVLNMQRKIKQLAIDTMPAKTKSKTEQANFPDGAPRTIFQEILKSNLPPEEKTIDHLWQAGQNVIGAGADTVALVLTLTTYYLLRDRERLDKLRAELLSASKGADGRFDLVTLQKLPYLTGVVLEGLRLSYGTSCRLSRIAPYEVLQFQDWKIPAGTPIGMSSLMMHHNEQIFPQSHEFLPERWSNSSDGGKSLERYLVSFSKGSRQCIGINIAKAEIFFVIATVFAKYGDNMNLYNCDFERDVALKHDMFLPQPSLESRGVQVVFK
ncbi:cytochrome P450 [Tricladium varicosporioides]|nr:cytochrome P450 [Hymenoscyphus varicosporioides]